MDEPALSSSSFPMRDAELLLHRLNHIQSCAGKKIQIGQANDRNVPFSVVLFRNHDWIYSFPFKQCPIIKLSNPLHFDLIDHSSPYYASATTSVVALSSLLGRYSNFVHFPVVALPVQLNARWKGCLFPRRILMDQRIQPRHLFLCSFLISSSLEIHCEQCNAKNSTKSINRRKSRASKSRRPT